MTIKLLKKGKLVWVFCWDKKYYPAIFLEYNKVSPGWCVIICNLADQGLRTCNMHESSISITC